jgi:glycosyltransferase involved in cell wall biosynthesis
MKSDSLLVSVVMPVYNGGPYVARAIDSVLAQAFSDFEFIIVNDGSTDDTESVIRSYADPRIRLITQPNHGFVFSLNRGIQLAKGVYIARMDADDISAPKRLSTQLALLESRPSIGVVGTAIIRIDESGRPLCTEYFLANDAELRQDLALRCPFAHGSVIMRRDLVQQVGGYRQEFWLAEDYDLWRRMAAVGELANSLEPLYFYREHSQGVTANNQSRMAEVAGRISRELLDRDCLKNDIPLSRVVASYRNIAEAPRVAAVSKILENYCRVMLDAARRGRIVLAAVRFAKILLGGRTSLEFAAKKITKRVRAVAITNEPA